MPPAKKNQPAQSGYIPVNIPSEEKPSAKPKQTKTPSSAKKIAHAAATHAAKSVSKGISVANAVPLAVKAVAGKLKPSQEPAIIKTRKVIGPAVGAPFVK